jgi:hypothetical protein
VSATDTYIEKTLTHIEFLLDTIDARLAAWAATTPAEGGETA